MEARAFERRRPAPWPVVILAVLLVAVVAAGGATVARRAGRSHNTEVSLGLLTAAQAKTARVNDYELTMNLKMSFAGHSFSERFHGELSQRPFLMSLQTELPEGMGALDERSVNHTLYMHLSSTNVNGKHWVGYRLPAGQTRTGLPTDPLSMLKQLSGAGGRVQRAGTKTIDGVRTTHYKASIDLKAVLDKLPSEVAQAVSSTGDALSSMPPIPIDVYIAPDDTVRRLTETMSFEGMHMKVEMDISPLGRRAHVLAPRASDVAMVSSFTELQSDLGVGGLG